MVVDCDTLSAKSKMASVTSTTERPHIEALREHLKTFETYSEDDDNVDGYERCSVCRAAAKSVELLCDGTLGTFDGSTAKRMKGYTFILREVGMNSIYPGFAGEMGTIRAMATILRIIIAREESL